VLDASYLLAKQNKGLTTSEETVKLKNVQLQLVELRKQLKGLEDGQKRSQRKRDHQKSVIQGLVLTDPDAAAKFRRKKSRGRSRLEDDQPELLKAIIDMACYGNSGMADDRRRLEQLRTAVTLDELKQALEPRFTVQNIV